MHQLTLQGRDYLLDCGMYQGPRQAAKERNSHFPFAAGSIAAVMLSHAHIDHSGNLPMLHKQGYNGPIFATPATADLCHAMLLDSAHIQESDAAFLNKRLQRRRSIAPERNGEQEVEPLYTEEDARGTLSLFRPVPLHTPTEIGPGLRYETYDAGHMLGSSSLFLTLQEAGRTVRLVFSGDVGRPGLPLIPDPERLPAADYLIIESTYGDRVHRDQGPVTGRLAELVNRTAAQEGKIVVPAFAVGRTQQLVVLLHELMDSGQIPKLKIFVDSPLAVEATDAFVRHPEALDEGVAEFAKRGEQPFRFPEVQYLRSVDQSKALNSLEGPYIVISASGMCESGRILHHLRHAIGDRRNLILLTGYQAERTLGRRLLDGEKDVRIFGDWMQVDAQVDKIDELSGHADQQELLRWMEPIVAKVKAVFLVHGEGSAQNTMAAQIRDRYGCNVVVPAWGDHVEL